METEVTANLTAVGPDTLNPCYEVDHFYHTVKNTPTIMCILFCIFLSLLSAIIICGNLLVIISIIYFKQLHTPTNYLIVSLAVADLLIGMIVLPFNIAFSETACLYYSSIFCKLRGHATPLLVLCSILNLGFISIDRYYAVCHPLTYRTKMSDHVVAIMILVSWGFPTITIIGNVFIGLNIESCIGTCLQVAAVFLLFILFLPLIILICILCIYLKIFLVAQRQVRSIQNTTCQSTTSGAKKMERKATKTLAIVLGVYLLCWLPYLSYSIMYFTGNSIAVSVLVIDIIIWIHLSNSMFNPFIYAFFYSWFRSAFRMILSGKTFQGDFTNSQLH